MAAVEPHSSTADGLVAPADVEHAAELIAGQVRETPVSSPAGLEPPWS